MSQIDWSKAPEGATHYAPAHRSFVALWAKLGSDGRYNYMPIDCSRDWYYGVPPGADESYIERPQAWAGTGLPPVGTVCDLDYSGTYQGQVEILFINKDVAVCRNLDDDRTQWGGVEFEYRFHPIKTQAQIEAEAREAAIQKMRGCLEMDEAYTVGTIMEALYDAGLRFPE